MTYLMNKMVVFGGRVMRVKYFDNAKGILIIFIILGHVFSACADYYGYEDNFFKFFSLFMIQCFFFISAYFSSKSKRKRIDKILNMFKIYLIWQILVTIYYSFVLKTMNFSLNILYPRYTYWFLVTLISYLLFEFIFEKVSFKVMIPLSFGLSLISGFIPFIGEYASLGRTFTFLPFYVIGFYAKDLKIMDKIRSSSFKKTFIFASVIILILLIVDDSIMPYRLLRGKYNYYDVTGSLLSVFLKRCLFYLFSVIVSVTFLKIISNNKTFFTRLGQNTLYVYLIQGVILKTLVTYNLLPSNIVLGNLFSIIILCALIFILKIIIDYFKKNVLERVDIEWMREIKIHLVNDLKISWQKICEIKN